MHLGWLRTRTARPELPAARGDTVALDLTGPESIERFAGSVASLTDRLHILLNSAGVANLDSLRRTPADREMHIAPTHYGHFLVTGHLSPLLACTPVARAVTVTSAAYRSGVIEFDDLDWRRRPCSGTKSYGGSKLANLLFMRELQKRFDTAGAAVLSVAAHPVLAVTERQQTVCIARALASPVGVGLRAQLRASSTSTVLDSTSAGRCAATRYAGRHAEMP